MGVVRNSDLEWPEAKNPINHMVIVFQLMQISPNVYSEV